MPTPPAAAADRRPVNPGGADSVSRLRLSVLRLSRRLRQHSEPGVTPSQLSVLATVQRAGAMTLGDLAAHEGVQPPSITRMVAGLEEAGLVARTSSAADRRSVLVDLTDEGARVLAATRRRRDAWLATRLARLSGEERRRLEAAIPVLEKLLEHRP